MKARKFLTGSILSLLLLISAAAVVSAHQDTLLPPPPFPAPGMGVSGICADPPYLYVVAGGKIYQYEMTEMTLQKEVELPAPPPPPEDTPLNKDEFRFFPPPHRMGGPPHGVWAGDGSLYVLAGPVIHRYTAPDLSFQVTVELPRPEVPNIAK